MDEKKKKLTQSLGDDSGEMEVLKDIFSSPEPDGASADIFSSDLFNVDPFAPAPAPPAPPLGARVPTPAPPKAEPAAALPPPAPAPAPPVKEQIKVVTNQDFEQLLQDQTSPGIPAPKPQPAPEPAKVAPAKAAPPLGERVPSPAPAPLPGKVAPKPAPAPAKAPAATARLEEFLEDIVLQAVAEDYHAVGAAKKGAALEQVAHELEGLQPMGNDFMSIEEMKKLFGNVNAILESIPRLCKRLDRLEEALAKAGLLGPEKK